MARRSKYKVLKPVHPNAGIRVEYRRKLNALVREMATSYEHWLKAQYRATPPQMAMDVLPARELEREMTLLGKRWQKKLNEAAPRMARWFATAAERRSMAGMKRILKDGGLSVEFQMTPAMRDVLHATVAENVALIKSIGSEYHTQVYGLVMRSVTAGRDLEVLSKGLRDRFDITTDRANLIALDQNNKATSTFVKVRQVDLGLKAKWLHSHGGKEPRPTHVANSGKIYDPATGWFDPDPKVRANIWPGQLIRCKCVSVSVVPGFS